MTEHLTGRRTNNPTGAVRAHDAAAARAATSLAVAAGAAAGGCGPAGPTSFVFGRALCLPDDTTALPDAAILASLGCDSSPSRGQRDPGRSDERRVPRGSDRGGPAPGGERNDRTTPSDRSTEEQR
ncbi:MAG: hypothetical protein H7269_15550 [Cellulomonas sp.]|nr:hypothetical protein [Cellulomonas sp.]